MELIGNKEVIVKSTNLTLEEEKEKLIEVGKILAVNFINYINENKKQEEVI